MTRSSGSDKRKRTKIITARVADDELRIVEQKAAEMGGISNLFRSAVLGYRPPRPRLDQEAMAKLLRELGRIRSELNKNGSNLNQLTHYANMSRTLEGSVMATLQAHDAILSDLMEMRLVIMQEMGYERDRKPPRKDDDLPPT